MISKNDRTLIDLIACSLSGKSRTLPETDREDVMAIARRHSVSGLAAGALKDPRSRTEKLRRVYSMTNLIREQEAVEAELDRRGIRHMALKGAVLRELYPYPELREMCDIDIFFDGTRREDVRELFAARGYITEDYGVSVDQYVKQPFFNFEMHRALFRKGHDPRFVRYYSDVEKRLKADGCRLAFTDEDFYIYFLAHSAKHYAQGGIGLRFLVDCFVYVRAKTLDMAYVSRELRKLGLKDFEQETRVLANKLFGTGEALTEREGSMLAYIMDSGAYGTKEHNFVNDIARHTKAGYIIRRIFLGREACRESYPFFYRHPVLLPVLWVRRIFEALTAKRGRALEILRSVNRIGK